MIFKYGFKKILKTRIKSKNIVFKVEYKVNTILYNWNENSHVRMFNCFLVFLFLTTYENKK